MTQIKRKQILEIERVDEITIIPEDFKDCNTIRDLKYKISGKFPESDKSYKLISENVDIPDDFIKEWKLLVGFIPNNVMTERERIRRTSFPEVYTEVYTGNYLNKRKYQYSWDIFDYSDYSDFIFCDDKHYRCYLIDSDHWDHTSTSLLFAEMID